MDEWEPEEQQLRLINHRLMRLDTLRRIVLQRTAKANGLFFGQLPILEYIAAHQGCTQNRIAEEIGVTPASIALSTKRLQRSGLIDKKADERNLRRNVLTITPKGIAHMESCRRQFDAVDRRMYAGLTRDELNAVMGLLDRMLENLSEGMDGLDDIYSMMVLVHQLEQEENAAEQGCGPPGANDVFADRRARMERRAAAMRERWTADGGGRPSSAGPSGKPERSGASRGLLDGEAADTAALEEKEGQHG